MIIDINAHSPFALAEKFLAPYRSRPVNWGFGALSWVTYRRTYSRDGEHWWQTCRRVIEGTFSIQRIYAAEHGIAWDENRAERMAEEAYERMFVFKWTPPGRGLWIMGTNFVYERGGAALNNCGFVSTRDLGSDFRSPFLWVFSMGMLGVGVGFDTRGAGKIRVRKPQETADIYEIEDTREGWCGALGRLLGAYEGKCALPAEWDYSRIRPQGTRLKSFGGYASGPGPLREMIDEIRMLLDAYVGKSADSRLIVDMMNLIGRCVVAGGIRRSAQIALGSPEDRVFVNLKRDPGKVKAYRWVSNISVIAQRGMDYSALSGLTEENGEPGYFWIENARSFGRMKDPPDHADAGAEGCNPCVEQTLWDRELCCLVETYPARHDTLEDYLRTLRIAYEYAKTVTLVPTHDEASNAVMSRNRRIGCSMTGVVQAIHRHGYRTFFNWCGRAYESLRQWDAEFSDYLGIPRSIKLTTVKPSGTVSLLAGATPGVHWGYAPYYLRRMRVQEDHPLVEACRKAGYRVEPDFYSKHTMTIAFPIHQKNVKRGQRQVPLREKVELAAQMQRHWSDNQVSCTATFDPDIERGQIGSILEENEGRLKAISFLPLQRHGYEQLPYEMISRHQYEEMQKEIRPLNIEIPHEPQLEARFCEGEECER